MATPLVARTRVADRVTGVTQIDRLAPSSALWVGSDPPVRAAHCRTWRPPRCCPRIAAAARCPQVIPHRNTGHDVDHAGALGEAARTILVSGHDDAVDLMWEIASRRARRRQLHACRPS